MRLGDMHAQSETATTQTPDVRRTWQLIGDPTVFVK